MPRLLSSFVESFRRCVFVAVLRFRFFEKGILSSSRSHVLIGGDSSLCCWRFLDVRELILSFDDRFELRGRGIVLFDLTLCGVVIGCLALPFPKLVFGLLDRTLFGGEPIFIGVRLPCGIFILEEVLVDDREMVLCLWFNDVADVLLGLL